MELIVTLSYVLPSIALGSIIFLIILNIYNKIRQLFPIKVNCWFCNTDALVGYNNRNSFECPTCLQYNGFEQDGSYNKIIEGQYDDVSNGRFKSKTSDLSNSNGLCCICNQYQSLRVQQLANFRPRNEKNYDKELKEFTKELDNLYKLCTTCKKVVKTTIHQQNKWLLGLKFLRMRTKGLSNFNQTRIQNDISHPVKRSLLLYSFDVLIVLLACFILLCIFSSIDNMKHFFYTNVLNSMLPYAIYLKEYFENISIGNVNVSTIILDLCNYFLMSCNKINSYMHHFFGADIVKYTNNTTHTAITVTYYDVPLHETVDLTFLSMIGLLLQMVISFLKYEQKHSLLKLLPWSVLIFITYSKATKFAPKFYVDMIQVAVSLSIIYFTVSHKPSTAKSKSDYKNKKHSFKRLNKYYNDDDSCDNEDIFSDNDEFHNSSPSSVLTNKKDNYGLPSSSFLKPFVKSVALKHISPKFSSSNWPKKFEHNTYDNITKKLREETAAFGAFNQNLGHTFGERAVFVNNLYGSTNSLNRSFSSDATYDSLTSTFSDKNFYGRNGNPDCSRWSPTSLNETFKTSNTHISCNNLNSTLLECYPETMKEFASDLPNCFSKLHVDTCRNGLKVNLKMAKTTPSVCSFNAVSRPKPVLTPPKLVDIHKSWNNGFANFCNLSRSSSETSGFASDTLRSQCGSLPSSRNHSPHNEFDRTSLLSEPAYHMNNFVESTPLLNGTFRSYSPF